MEIIIFKLKFNIKNTEMGCDERYHDNTTKSGGRLAQRESVSFVKFDFSGPIFDSAVHQVFFVGDKILLLHNVRH